ncbi:MAG TPA: zf-HC2 domain-containing protein, partial [Acidimicrobiales bacterium]|nr:zf-HC2 domain-containing protein [Acidimicrobiales bacterium]
MADAGSCNPFRDDLAEFALGTLSGRQRAGVIDHLERCVECSAELEGLSIAADSLLLIAPEATPPAGFDQRVLSGMTGGRDRHGPL